MPARHHLRPALIWALAHGLLVVWFFRRALGDAAADMLPALRAPLWAGFAIEGLFLGLLAFVATLPLLALRRAYALAAPILVAIVTAFFYVDSLVFDALGFHVNGLVLTVAMQPGGGLAETGLPKGEVALLVGAIAAAVAIDAWLGAWFLRRFASSRKAWSWALGILLLWTLERVGSAGLIFTGGPPAETASTLMPLQPLVRMNKQLAALTGRQPVRELALGGLPQVATPLGRLDPAEVRFERKPDVVFLLIESLPSTFLTDEVMPNLSALSREATVFERHYSAAAATQFSLYSILFGLDAQRRDAVIGAGRTPLLFPAMKNNGYGVHLLAASSVDWMDLKETVFHDVTDGLETDFPGDGNGRDEAMIARAGEILETAPKDQPLFLFLFFAGTHFNYTYPPRSAVFEPAWDGAGTLTASRVPSEQLQNRARNAAREVDTKIAEFLAAYRTRRGGAPLLFVTGDHGEEFNESGRIGHSSDVSAAQIHVPMIVKDEALPPGRIDAPTGHVDLLPTLFSLLGDDHDTALFSDGMPMQHAPADRYVLSMVGWTRKFALVGKDLKVSFMEGQTSPKGVRVTDPFDRPLADGEARFAAEAPRMLRRLRGQAQMRASGD